MRKVESKKAEVVSRVIVEELQEQIKDAGKTNGD